MFSLFLVIAKWLLHTAIYMTLSFLSSVLIFCLSRLSTVICLLCIIIQVFLVVYGVCILELLACSF